MKFNSLVIFCFCCLIFACAGSRNFGTSIQQEKLEKMVANKEFEIVSTWARPLGSTAFIQVANSGLLPPGSSATNINLIGTSNYLRLKKDSVFIDLPFFGERRRGGGYNDSSGISFVGKYDDYKSSYDEKKKLYLINFDVKNKMESIDFTITLFSNLRTIINVNSSDRSFIDFDGNVDVIENGE